MCESVYTSLKQKFISAKSEGEGGGGPTETRTLASVHTLQTHFALVGEPPLSLSRLKAGGVGMGVAGSDL